jgi:hypothetical protein
MATTWTISTLERELSDGGVIAAHWRATDVDGEYSATFYGSCGFTYDASSPDFTPYDNLTETQVLGWCWSNGVDQEDIEASLAAKIESDKNPTQANGVPW